MIVSSGTNQITVTNNASGITFENLTLRNTSTSNTNTNPRPCATSARSAN